MPGPLSSSRPYNGDQNLTGGPSTSTSSEFEANARQVKRTNHMLREAPLGGRTVSNGVATKDLNQKAPSMSNLRTKSSFKARRKRK